MRQDSGDRFLTSRAWSANRFEVLEPVRQGGIAASEPSHPGWRGGLKLRHDHGSNYIVRRFPRRNRILGIEASPSFVREPEGNGVAERFIRTLKEQPGWPGLRAAAGQRPFDTPQSVALRHGGAAIQM